jgi:hypothetical protein
MVTGGGVRSAGFEGRMKHDDDDTPYTDEMVEKLYGPLSATFPSSLAARFADFARSLERRLQAAEAELARLRSEMTAATRVK